MPSRTAVGSRLDGEKLVLRLTKPVFACSWLAGLLACLLWSTGQDRTGQGKKVSMGWRWRWDGAVKLDSGSPPSMCFEG